MSTLPISTSVIENNHIQPLEKSSSLAGKVITKVYKTTSYLICSIGSIVQSIFSECIYVGSFGRYTLDDLKSYLFKKQSSLEDKVIPKPSSEETDNREEESANESSRSNLQRRDSTVSKISVTPSFLERVKGIGGGSSPYAVCYTAIGELVKPSGNPDNAQNVQ